MTVLHRSTNTIQGVIISTRPAQSSTKPLLALLSAWAAEAEMGATAIQG